ncbi:MAG: FMN-binding negative transcriptional regulator [Acidobacteria bacterium]|nr:FMN-binding negative transcriptional regulator [Acidobacteriota bacterium]
MAYQPLFEGKDPEIAYHLLRAYPFVPFVSGENVTHIPMCRQLGSDALLGHMAGQNPQVENLGQGNHLVIVQGPHAYVSPTFYESSNQVPTWNYAVAHFVGTNQLLTGHEKIEAMALLVSLFESEWNLNHLDHRVRDRLMENLVFFRFTPKKVRVRLKLSQNKTTPDREAVMRALQNAKDEQSLACAAWMTDFYSSSGVFQACPKACEESGSAGGERTA